MKKEFDYKEYAKAILEDGDGTPTEKEINDFAEWLKEEVEQTGNTF